MVNLIRIMLVMLALPATSAITAESLSLDPSRIGWDKVRFRASKLFFSVNTEVGIERVTRSDVADSILSPQTGVGVELADDVIRLHLGTDAFGRFNDMVLLANTLSGIAVQRVTHETGGRLRHRIYRFTDIGAYHDTRKPEGEDQENLPEDWQKWTNRGTGIYEYPDEAKHQPVTEPAALLYIVGAARLDKPGDYLKTLAYARKRVHRVHIDVVESVEYDANYTQWSGGQGTEVRGKRTALRLLIEGEPVGEGDPEDEFELMGLRGKMELLLDPATRAPLQLTGRVKIAGKVVLKIQHLVLGADRMPQ